MLTRLDRDGVKQADIPVGSQPRLIAFGPDAVWVSDFGAGTVVRVDPVAAVAETSQPLCQGPQGMAVDDGVLWVACTTSGEVLAVDTATLAVRGRVAVGKAQARKGHGFSVMEVISPTNRIPFETQCGTDVRVPLLVNSRRQRLLTLSIHRVPRPILNPFQASPQTIGGVIPRLPELPVRGEPPPLRARSPFQPKQRSKAKLCCSSI